MRIGGLLKFSLIDYPGKVAAVVFTQGCNFRCPFCHNPELVLPELFGDPLSVDDVFAFLKKRQGQLQAVVVTGGEPTLHSESLLDFLSRIKSMGYLVKLDTNGSRPDVLATVIESGLVDYIAMDIKAAPSSYCQATGIQLNVATIKESIRLIKSSGIAHEFRTTMFKTLMASERDLSEIAELIGVGQPHNLRRGLISDKILDYDYFADKSDYTRQEWEMIKSRHSAGDVID